MVLVRPSLHAVALIALIAVTASCSQSIEPSSSASSAPTPLETTTTTISQAATPVEPTPMPVPSVSSPPGTQVVGDMTVASAMSALQRAGYACDQSPSGPPGMADGALFACTRQLNDGAMLSLSAPFWSNTEIVAVDIAVLPADGADMGTSAAAIGNAVESLYAGQVATDVLSWIADAMQDPACVEQPCILDAEGASFGAAWGVRGAAGLTIRGTTTP